MDAISCYAFCILCCFTLIVIYVTHLQVSTPQYKASVSLATTNPYETNPFETSPSPLHHVSTHESYASEETVTRCIDRKVKNLDGTLGNDGYSVCWSVLAGSIGTARSAMQNTSPGPALIKYTPPSGERSARRAWGPFPTSLQVADPSKALLKGMQPPTSIKNVTDVRIDNRLITLKPPYAVQELTIKPVPQSIIIAGNKFVKSAPSDVIRTSLIGDLLGSTGRQGDFDVQAFVVITNPDIAKDSTLVGNICASYKSILENFQDDVYMISNQRLRCTRVNLALVGITQLSGTVNIYGSFDISKSSTASEWAVIKSACSHVASVYGWDDAHSLQKMYFMLDKTHFGEPKAAACADARSCNMMMNHPGSYMNTRNYTIRDIVGARFVVLHEFLHTLGLGHTGASNMEYGDNTSIMGSYLSWDGITRINAIQRFQLGWIDDAQFVNIDALDSQNGTIVVVPDSENASVFVVAPVILMDIEKKSFSGYLPVPVVSLAMMRDAKGNKRCYVHVPPKTYPTANVFSMSYFEKYNTVYKFSLGGSDADTVSLTNLPPYLITQSSQKGSADSMHVFVQALRLPYPNERGNTTLRFQALGKLANGDVRIMITRA